MKVNMAETDITRMSSDYADNELELFRKTVSCPFQSPFVRQIDVLYVFLIQSNSLWW